MGHNGRKADVPLRPVLTDFVKIEGSPEALSKALPRSMFTLKSIARLNGANQNSLDYEPTFSGVYRLGVCLPDLRDLSPVHTLRPNCVIPRPVF